MSDASRTALLLAVLLTGCADRRSGPAYVQRWDSAGTEIVEHASLVPTGSLKVPAEPAVWIEGDEQIPPFARITSIALLEDGSIAVADGGTNQIHAFSPEGTYRWSVGRPGEGPGEFPSDQRPVRDPR